MGDDAAKERAVDGACIAVLGSEKSILAPTATFRAAAGIAKAREAGRRSIVGIQVGAVGGEGSDDLLVGELREVLIPAPDRTEALR